MEHTAKGAHKILKECRLPLTAAGQVNMIITEMGVMEITDKGIVLREIHPEFTVEQVHVYGEAGDVQVSSKDLMGEAKTRIAKLFENVQSLEGKTLYGGVEVVPAIGALVEAKVAE
jgi:hypothetical protein